MDAKRRKESVAVAPPPAVPPGSFQFGIELLPDPAMIFALDGTILEVNAAAVELFEGDRADQLLGRNVYTTGVVGQPSAPAAAGKVQSGHRVHFELDILTLKGNSHHIDVVATPMAGGDGKGGVVLGLARDITAQARAEREQAFLASIVESSSDAIISTGLDQIIRSWNKGAENLLGFSAAEAIGQPITIIIPPDEREGAGQIYAEISADPARVFKSENLTLRKDGAAIETSIAIFGICDRGGELVGLSAILRDITEQKRTEREVARLAAIVESSDDAITSISSDFIVTSWNRSAETLLGLSAQEAIGQPLLDTVAPEVRERVRSEMMADFAATLERRDFVRRQEIALPRKDGSITEVSLVVSAIRDKAGNLLGMSQIFRDISGLRRATREQALLAAIVSSTDDAIMSLSLDGRISSWNRGAEALLGFSSAEALGKTIALHSPPEMRAIAEESVRSQMAAARERRILERMEIPLQRKDSTRLDASIVVSGIYDSTGALIGLSGIIRDITERKRVERELSVLASIVNASSDAIVAVDKEGRIIAWNPAAERVYGHSAQEALGRGLELFVPPEELQQQLDTDRMILRTGQTASYEHQARGRDGSSFTSLVEVFPIRDAAGNITGVGGIGRNISRLKQIETELREAHEYTRGLIESSIDAMVIVAPDMRIVDGNEQLARLTELPKKVLFGSRFDSHFANPEAARAAVEKALVEGFVANADLTLKTAGGRDIEVSFSASLFYRRGEVFGIFGVARDVAEQRATERILREEREYSRSLVQSFPDALLVSDRTLTLTDINERSIQLTGYTRGELVGSNVISLFTDPIRAAQVLEKARDSGLAHESELFVLTKSAHDVPVALNASAIAEHNNAGGSIVIALHDVTEERRAQKIDSLLAAIVGSSGDAIYSETTVMIITSWNPAAETLFGYTAAEVVGRSAVLLAPLERRAELAERAQRICRSRSAERYETVRQRKDGSLIEVAVTQSPIFDASEAVTGLSVTVRDIGERKRMEQELTRVRDAALERPRLNAEFLTNMSHAIRAPLDSVIGLTGRLLDSGLDADQQKFAHEARERGEFLLALVSEIVDFSSICAADFTLAELDFDLNEVTQSAAAMMADKVQRKGLGLTVTVGADVPRFLHGDPGCLRQVLLNLLSNAVKFTPQGEIVLRVSKVSENPTEVTARFEVRDTGIGIPGDKLHLLFEPFAQLDAAITSHYGGVGLGLAIARELVERMGGRIDVSSTPGAGSTFSFTATLARAVGASLPVPVPSTPAADKLGASPRSE